MSKRGQHLAFIACASKLYLLFHFEHNKIIIVRDVIYSVTYSSIRDCQMIYLLKQGDS